ncbi:MAG TPA: copper chaperone PCu(A)C [Xanthobacteraceae bacterium]|jgi:copper(I)-binding protein|nr:copper chaperone PCu(A)C [Xanthobacteraceae bacterium]
MKKFDSKCAYGASAILALTAQMLLSPPAQAADYDVGSIHISQPWSRATPKGATSGAGYMTITNKGTVPDRLNCVSSNASAQCQIHTMTMEDGVMKMRPVEGGLEIAPGATITLKPGGFHMMLLDLKHPLEQGQNVKATLKFDNAGTVDVEYPVAAIGAPAPGAADAGGSMMMGGDHGGGMMMAPSGGNSGGGMMQMKKQ